jgi:hypothetical protein
MIGQANIKLLLMPSVILIILRRAQGKKSILATVQIGVPKSQLNIDMIVRGSDTGDLESRNNTVIDKASTSRGSANTAIA